MPKTNLKIAKAAAYARLSRANKRVMVIERNVRNAGGNIFKSKKMYNAVKTSNKMYAQWIEALKKA